MTLAGPKFAIFDPKTTFGRPLLDHPISAGEQRGWHRETERIGGFEIDHQLERGALLDREVGWLSALQQFPGVGPRLPN